MKRLLLSLSLPLLLCLSAQMANAQASDLPVDLIADQGEYDGATGVATYTGNVVITQGDMKLTGDKVVIHTQGGKISSVESWGNLATFHYVPANEPAVDGKGKYMKYNVPGGVVDIEGEAYVKQAQNDTHGDTLSYNLNSEIVTGKRVKMSFLPASS